MVSYWTRDGRTEVDLFGIEGNGIKRRASFIGSNKLEKRRPFSDADASALEAQLPVVPGVDDLTVLLAVSSSGSTCATSPSPSAPSNFSRRGHRNFGYDTFTRSASEAGDCPAPDRWSTSLR